MIVRNTSGFRASVRMIVGRNWAVVVIVLAIEWGALELHRVLPGLQTSAFSEAGVGVLAGTVGVFLAFRFNEAYGRWWEARILWGGLVNASRTFGRQTLSYVARDDAEACALRDELIRGQIGYVNALRCALRGEDGLAAAKPFLSADALRELAGARNLPTQIIARQNRLLAPSEPSDAAAAITLSRFDATFAEITALQGGMERIKNTAFSDRVIVTSRLLVWAVTFLVCLAFIDPVDVIYVMEFIAILMIVLSFMLVVQLGEELNDPFENRENDTPMTSLCRTIEIDLLQMLGETDLPDPILPEKGVLM
jgi:putative membrane protein